MNSFLRFIFLSSVLLFVALNGCADFVFILGTNIQSETTNDNSSVSRNYFLFLKIDFKKIK